MELNSQQKPRWAHLSTSSQSRAGGSKYYNAHKWQLTFTLEQLPIFNQLLSMLSLIIKGGSYRL